MNSLCSLLSTTASDRRGGLLLRHCGGVGVGYSTENLCDLFIALTTNRHRVAHAHHLKELHDVAIAKADAAVRSGVTDRVRLVGSVDAKAFLAEADPSWADGVVAARRDDRTRVVVSRVSEAIDDLEFAGGTWADRRSN